MELSVTQENLAKALSNVSRVASSRAGLPILSNILLRTEGNRLLVAATNLEIAETYYVGAKVIKQGSITLPARLVTEFVSSLPKDTVTLASKGSRVTISSGQYTSIINGVASDEFPELPVIDEKKTVSYTINAPDFKEAVNQTIITCSSDSTRPVLTGVYWHSAKGSLVLAATDGYRLAERVLMPIKNEIAAIVPASSLQEVLRSLADSHEAVDVLFDEAQVKFRIGEVEITSRLIDGKYPDYHQLIPAESETSITMSRDEFGRVVKIAGLFARDSGGSITLVAEKETEQLTVTSIASEYGENSSSIDAIITHDGQVTLNSRYISEALSVLAGEKIELRFSGKLSPCVLSVVEKNRDYTHIIMPLKS